MIRSIPLHHSALPAVLCLVYLALAGCAPKPFAPPPPGSTFAGYVSDDKRTTLPMFDGRDGKPILWPQIMAAIDWADVVLIGEQHNDAAGHAVELALVEQMLAHSPRAAVSMEMFERDEQELVDDYLDGIISSEALVKRTFSSGWAGEGKWEQWYQPIVDAVKREPRAGLIASNAPRQYVRMARAEGYERLRKVPMPRRALFNLPVGKIDEPYRERFFRLMSHSDRPEAAADRSGQPDELEKADEPKPSGPAQAHAAPMTPEQIEAIFRSQLIWDATMAGSIDKALRGGRKKVAHIVGAFHVDFNGGTVQQVRARQRGAEIVTISLRPHDATSLRDEDRGRADIIIYTGEAPRQAADEKIETSREPIINR